MSLDDASLQSPDYLATQFAKSFSSPTILEPNVQLKSDLIHQPDPLTLYFGYFGRKNWNSAFTKQLLSILERSSQRINRPLRQDEVDFFVEETSVVTTTKRMGAPLGALAGITKFLAYEKQGRVLTQYAPQVGSMSPAKRLLEGMKTMYVTDPVLTRAFAGTLLARTAAWSVGGWMFIGMYSVISRAAQMAKDSRMKDYLAELQRHDPEQARQRQVQAVMEKSRARKQQQQQQQDPEQPIEVPTAQYESGEPGGYQGYSSSIGSMSRSTDIPVSSAGGAGTYRYSTPAEQDKGVGFFDDDDASPTAPEYRGITRQGNSAAQGSVWDRIRQSQSQDPAKSSSKPQGGDTWGRSDAPSANSDIQRERERAQAEFDRMIESERNRSSDSETGARRSGWWN